MVFQDVFHVIATKGAARYGAEPVSQLEHALQCAALAERAGAPSSLITAALLHDIGHLIEDDETAVARGLDLCHEVCGALALRALFPKAVTEPIRLHVSAKRYLCAVNEGYFNRLSPASVASLALQGGPMAPAEAAEFAETPYAKAAAALRVWDDLAKDPTAQTPDLAHFRRHAEAALGEAALGPVR